MSPLPSSFHCPQYERTIFRLRFSLFLLLAPFLDQLYGLLYLLLLLIVLDALQFAFQLSVYYAYAP